MTNEEKQKLMELLSTKKQDEESASLEGSVFDTPEDAIRRNMSPENMVLGMGMGTIGKPVQAAAKPAFEGLKGLLGKIQGARMDKLAEAADAAPAISAIEASEPKGISRYLLNKHIDPNRADRAERAARKRVRAGEVDIPIGTPEQRAMMEDRAMRAQNAKEAAALENEAKVRSLNEDTNVLFGDVPSIPTGPTGTLKDLPAYLEQKRAAALAQGQGPVRTKMSLPSVDPEELRALLNKRGLKESTPTPGSIDKLDLESVQKSLKDPNGLGSLLNDAQKAIYHEGKPKGMTLEQYKAMPVSEQGALIREMLGDIKNNPDRHYKSPKLESMTIDQLDDEIVRRERASDIHGIRDVEAELEKRKK